MPEARLLHIDGREHNIIKEVIKYYRNKDTLISIDTGNFRRKTLDLLPLVDIIIMPRRFGTELFGDYSLAELIKKVGYKYNSKAIIITDGINGSVCSSNGKIFRQKAFSVKPFDTTGAGDIHVSGILFGFLQNWDIPKTLEFTAACAAIKCQGLGNTNTLPDYNQVIDFIKDSNCNIDNLNLLTNKI